VISLGLKTVPIAAQPEIIRICRATANLEDIQERKIAILETIQECGTLARRKLGERGSLASESSKRTGREKEITLF
jgi:hypothetical protein